MIALLTLCFVASCLAGSQPSPSLTVLTRDGRQAEIRFITQLSNPAVGAFAGATFQLNGNTYNGQAPTATVKLGANPTAVFTQTITSSSLTFTEVDTGINGQGTVSLSFPLATTVNVGCPPVNKNDRVTYVLKQTIISTPAPITNTGTCSAGGGACTQVTGTTIGQVSVTCDAVVDSIATKTRDCAKVPVRFYNLHNACDSQKPFLFESAEVVGVSKTFLTTPTIPTGFGTTQLDLDRKVELQINDVKLFDSATTARFVDAFISESGVVTNTGTFSTAFINVVNLAYRVTAGIVDNSFTIVVSQSNSISSLSDVVHFQQGVNPGAASGWIEVPVGDYFVHVFDNDDIETAIFGDNSQATPQPATATRLVVSADPVTLAANDARVFRIINEATTATLKVNSVPLNNADVPVDNTRFVLWNSIVDKSAKLANPDATCCNFLADGNDGGQTFAHGAGSAGADDNTLSPPPRNIGSTTFSVFSGAATCTNLGAPIVPGTVTLNDVTSTTQCSQEGVFLFGRAVTVQPQVCTGTAVSGVCQTPTLVGQSEVIVSLTGAPTDVTPASVVSLNLNFPLCDCVQITSACAPLTCEEQRTQLAQIGAISGQIAASTAAVTAAVTASQNSLAVVLADTNADVGNTNATLLAAINARTSSLASGITRLEGDVEDVLDDIDDLGDDVDDLGDDIDSAVDAIEDVQDAVDDLE